MTKREKKFNLTLESCKSLDISEYNTKSKTVDSALKLLAVAKYVVFKIENEVNKRVYIGVTKQSLYYTKDIIWHYCTEGYMRADSEEHGIGSFFIEPLGFFPSRSKANIYKNFAINMYLDHGKTMYNDAAYTSKFPRILSLRLDQELREKVTNYAFAEKIKATSFLKRILSQFFQD